MIVVFLHTSYIFFNYRETNTDLSQFIIRSKLADIYSFKYYSSQ